MRVPRDGGLARKRAALADGVELYPGIIEQLGAWAVELGVAMPELR